MTMTVPVVTVKDWHAATDADRAFLAMTVLSGLGGMLVSFAARDNRSLRIVLVLLVGSVVPLLFAVHDLTRQMDRTAALVRDLRAQTLDTTAPQAAKESETREED